MHRPNDTLRAAINGMELYDRLLVALTEMAKGHKFGNDRVTARNLLMLCLIGVAPGGTIQTYRANRQHALNVPHHIKVLVERGHVVLQQRNRGTGYAAQLTQSGRELYKQALRALR